MAKKPATDISFYEVWSEVRSIRKEMGFGGSYDSYKLMCMMADMWAKRTSGQTEFLRHIVIEPIAS